MTTQAMRTYTLELDAEADPIAGRLRDEAGDDLDFVGWLGLASALERLLAEEDLLDRLSD